eukprot:5348752-Pleurochrysis_carterae.AAC.6
MFITRDLTGATVRGGRVMATLSTTGAATVCEQAEALRLGAPTELWAGGANGRARPCASDI